MCIMLCSFLSVCLFISSIVVIFVTTTHHSYSYTNTEHPLYVKKVLDGKDGAIKKGKENIKFLPSLNLINVNLEL